METFGRSFGGPLQVDESYCAGALERSAKPGNEEREAEDDAETQRMLSFAEEKRRELKAGFLTQSSRRWEHREEGTTVEQRVTRGSV
jgi:hypothetical protein